MRARVPGLVLPAAILAAAAFRADAAAAADPASLSATTSPDATVSEAAAVPGPQDEATIGDAAGAAPSSRLLQSLGARAAQQPSPQESAEDHAAGPDSDVAGGQVAGILYGCPRALLGSLLAGAADTADAVSALAIERETLALCRERQEIVNGIVALEGELGTFLAEAQARAARPVEGSVGSTVAETPIVKESAPVRVVSLPPPASAAGEAPTEAEAPEDPAPPSYFWFSIIGTAGDLRAGVSGGAGNGGTSVWFVREGDRLPGGVTVMRIVARPPGVHMGGALEAALPYRPRPAGTAGTRDNARESGNTAAGGDTPSGGNTRSGVRTAGDGF